jgi:DNA polymerase-4
VIICLDMDAFFASVECALRPELQGRPVVVGGSPEGRGVVTSASYEARAYGIHAAMPAAQAHRLCPHAIFVPSHFDEYRRASRQVRAILDDLSPWVEMVSIDEAFVDLSGTERALGAPLEVARGLQERVRRELGLPCSIGIAGNKLLAKVACSQSKPRGLRQVLLGEEAAFLAPLPATAIPGVGPHTAARLAELRIRTCRDLAAVPLPVLRNLLGQHADSLQRRARGVDNSRVAPHEGPAQSISRGTTFGEDSRDPAFLRAVLYGLVEHVGQALRRQEQSAGCVAVQVRWADFTTQSHQRTLSPPAASDDPIYRMAGELLDYLLARDRQRVRLLRVEVSHLLPRGEQLPLLLSDRARAQRALALSRCLDRIRGVHGFHAIRRGTNLLLRGEFDEVEGGDW